MIFEGRTLLIVTKHGKERVLAPLLESELGIRCIVADGFDTDALGTFSGEVDREGTALETLRRKCRDGMKAFGCDLAVASEGSFGPHPSIFFASADDELLMLTDAKNQLEIVVRELSLETNFSNTAISDMEQLEEFLSLAFFPKHAVIVRIRQKSSEGLVKGITDKGFLTDIALRYLRQYGSFYIETDMRAMHNPKRMEVIAKAAIKLVAKVKCNCPKCGIPGFGVADVRDGLPCQLCGCATSSTLSYIYRCLKCGFSDEKYHPNGKQTEDPMYCDRCNP